MFADFMRSRSHANDFNASLLEVRARKPDVLYLVVQNDDAVQMAKQIQVARPGIANLIGQAQLHEWQNAVGDAQNRCKQTTTHLNGLTNPADKRDPRLYPSAVEGKTQWKAKFDEASEVPRSRLLRLDDVGPASGETDQVGGPRGTARRTRGEGLHGADGARRIRAESNRPVASLPGSQNGGRMHLADRTAVRRDVGARERDDGCLVRAWRGEAFAGRGTQLLGRELLQGGPQEVIRHPDVIHAYLGHRLETDPA
jgi:hypothetical protein